MKWMDRIDAVAKRLERFASGAAPTDPLYVSNRTLGQKVRFGFLIGVPVLVLSLFVLLAMNKYFDSQLARQSAEAPAPAAVPTAAKVLPNLEKDFAPAVDASREVEVLEASVQTADHHLIGKVRNNTDHPVQIAELVFDVTDEGGSQLGGVAVRVENLKPRSVRQFDTALQQRTAFGALVREIHSR
jgi:hypothetical protein